MNKFEFGRSETTEERQRNWEQFIDNTPCFEFNPFYPSDDPVGAGFSGVSSYWGTYAAFGPLVFFSITLLGTAITWGVSSVVRLPITYALRTATIAQQQGVAFPATQQSGWTDNGFGRPHVFCGTTSGQALYAAYSEATGYNEVQISGIYYR